jgi:DNA gyrase subunit B
VQLLVQVIGTGIGTEFDLAKLRYHRVIVMTDADVDGAHIRTLVLTFLYRHMPELFDHGHVYIAVPPLYLARFGNQQSYLEKDSQLEELLVRERFPELEIEGRAIAATAAAAKKPAEVKLTQGRYSRFTKLLAEYQGWAARLRADFGHPAADFVLSHRLVEVDADTPESAHKAIAKFPANGYALESKADKNALHVKVVELETNATQNVVVPVDLFASPIYDRVRKAHAALGDAIGALPPFNVKLGRNAEEALTFEQLRDVAIMLAKGGLQITRFKGLSEMNPVELWATTMDPSRRMLIRVDVEDAAAADLWFSRLMGDEVEPRREFIEQNALEVKNLDV